MLKNNVARIVRVFAVLILVIVLTRLPVADVAAQQGRSVGEYAPDAVLVQFLPGAGAEVVAAAEAAAGGDIVKEYSLVPGLTYMHLSADVDVMQTIEKLKGIDGVVYAEPDYVVYPTDTIPNDTRWAEQWAFATVRAPLAWDTSTGAGDVVVAVIDTGVDTTHPDLINNLWTNPDEIAGNGIDDDNNGYIDDIHGWDFYDNDNNPMDSNSHGTHTAGTICAEGNNGQGVAGVVWRCKIMALRFIGPNGGFSSAVVDALSYLVAKQVKLSNNSWGGDGYSVSLYNAINNAKAVNHLFIAAAGNNNSDNDAVAFYPSSYNLDNIVAVAASDEANAKASFSNWGAMRVDLAAPGVSILSTVPNAGYATLSGTSMAAPLVTGALATLYGLHPGWTYQQARDNLFATVQRTDSMPGLTVTGGILDLAAAAEAAAAAPQDPTNLAASSHVTNQIDLAWSDNASNESGYAIERSIDQVAWERIMTLPSNSTAAIDTGCLSLECFYRVQAINDFGYSGYSNVVSATPLLPPGIHVGDLDGSSVLSRPKQWDATVTILVHDEYHAPVANATVTGVWSNKMGQSTCRTDGAGQCSVLKSKLKTNIPSISFRITAIAEATHPYQPNFNHDPDGDSTGTVIVVTRPASFGVNVRG